MKNEQHIWLLSRELYTVDKDGYDTLLGVFPLGYFPGTDKGKLDGRNKAAEIIIELATRQGSPNVKEHDAGNETRHWIDDKDREQRTGDKQVLVLRRVYKKVRG